MAGEGMSVDIDIGGNDIDEIEDEDVITVEEVEEVEVLEEEKPVEPIKERAPPAAKKPSKWIKRILVVVVVIILIIVTLWAFVYFTTEVTNISVGLATNDPNNPDDLVVTVLVGASGSASIAGEADLKITLDDEVIYTSKVSINDDGTGTLVLPYHNFVEGNGNYYFQVEYKGKTSPLAEYKEEHIVESLSITAEVGPVDGTGQLNLTVFLDIEPDDAQISVDEIRNLDDNSYITTGEDPESVTDTFWEAEFPSYSESGNYSITVTLENSRVKSDSDYFKISKTEEFFLNIRPIAIEEHVVTENTPLSYTVEFDAGDSWNDGSITRFIWDFDGDGSIDADTEDPIVTYTYSKLGSTLGQPQGTYLTTLNVRGDIIEEATSELEIGYKTIKIEPP